MNEMNWSTVEGEVLSSYGRELAYSLTYRELLWVYVNSGYTFCQESRLTQCGSRFTSIQLLQDLSQDEFVQLQTVVLCEICLSDLIPKAIFSTNERI